ncbi:Chemotaxis protein methyltransferase [Hartmannibacter diazotrophicus]|uniref:Chemotaxis protein methyltransferase n=1 Tax=Hartmannibacter diazotrophicus TaxID=1482074 RepID=A0A2C9D181_9HYPH|nr:protein-glutamate O-methyltransferase CheR [Hartmannibacter diazotrophicus]SON53983.1 Chemotaxis protein methyltransferase [Hartmannibacter diazotrophicus]
MSASAAAHVPSEFDHLGAREFERLASFINSYSGIKMPSNKRTMLEGRLRRRLRATGLPTFSDYCRYLFDEDGLEREAIFLIDVVTTNKTDFFREAGHFNVLRDTIVPDLADRGVTDLRIWSAACSTGAEPYTMAMVLEEEVSERRLGSYSVLATDLSTDVLATALKGIYPTGMVRPVPAAMKRKYVLQPKETHMDCVRIHPRLRSRVGFARMNLMDESYPVTEPMHVIFCRNVLIYFDKPTQSKVLTRLCDCLVPGGYLAIGHSETISGFNLPLRTISNTVFQKL